MASILRRITAEDRREAADALDDLKATLAYAGTQLPSPGIDWQCASVTGIVLIDLGAAPTSVILQIVDLLRLGVRAQRARAEQQPWHPELGSAVTLNRAGGTPLPARVVGTSEKVITVRLDSWLIT
ncbi:hypothetical protein [Streptomyces sp. NRRL WC-3742]|uniref:hypothetical protein n=1 Tax=Streptomyces sp. NRRL WC-3742 TaxID=1463934 RepID=UPI0004CB0328|nr:hypothetical protein [Streptomyces sp. NRRL WC-3742]